MKSALRSSLQFWLNRIPLWIYRRILRRQMIGVFYHSVSQQPLSHIEHLYPSIPVNRFENDLLFLKKNYALVSYQQLHQYVNRGKPLPPRALHLSFDDGYAECFTLVRPLLLKYGIPCTFFITSDLIDNRRMFYRNKVSLCIQRGALLFRDDQAGSQVLTSFHQQLDRSVRSFADFVAWIKPLVQADEVKIDLACEILGVDVDDYLASQAPYLNSAQIQQLFRDGFTIGSHTRSHPKLVQLSPIEMEAEIVASTRIVAEITGAATVPFSFPNSGTGVERRVLADIRSRHPLLGLFFDTKGIRLDEKYILNRIWAERPSLSSPGDQTALGRVLRNAYAEQAWENMAAFRSGL